MDRHEAGYNKRKRPEVIQGEVPAGVSAAEAIRLLQQPYLAELDVLTHAQFRRMLDAYHITLPALPALVLTENRLNALAGQCRGASHLDIIEVRALVREAGSDKEPWK